MTISSATAARSGLQVIAGQYKEIRQAVEDLMVERVAKLPWVPAQSIADFFTFRRSLEPAATVIPKSAIGVAGRPNGDNPPWLAGHENEWQQIFRAVQTAQVAVATGKIIEAQEELARLQANSAFWEGVGHVMEGVSDALSGASEGIKQGLSTVVKVVATIAIVGGIGVWYYKDPEGFKRFWGGLFGRKK